MEQAPVLAYVMSVVITGALVIASIRKGGLWLWIFLGLTILGVFFQSIQLKLLLAAMECLAPILIVLAYKRRPNTT